jgi:cytochrome b561
LTEPKRARWSSAVIALHWLGAALILELLAHGWLMVHGGFPAGRTFELFQWHKSLGFVAAAVTLARLAARSLTRAPPKIAAALWEQRLSGFVQGLLYALTLVVIAAGWLAVSTSPLPIPTLFFGGFIVPPITGPDPGLFGAATLVHAVGAAAIAALVALHVAGALRHRFVVRDTVMERIWPRIRVTRPSPRPPPPPSAPTAVGRARLP